MPLGPAPTPSREMGQGFRAAALQVGLRETDLFWGPCNGKEICGRGCSAWVSQGTLSPQVPPLLVRPGQPGQGTGGTVGPCTLGSPAWGLALRGQFTLSSLDTSLPLLQLNVQRTSREPPSSANRRLGGLGEQQPLGWDGVGWDVLG